MGRVQNANYPYMQMCVRYDTTVGDGVEIAKRNESDKWDVMAAGSYTGKAIDNYNVYTLDAQGNKLWGTINGEQVISCDNGLYTAGAMGLQAKGLRITVDYVKVTLGSTSALDDTAVKCTVSKTRPAIGCNAGQTILLSECDVQFTYGFPVVDGSQIVWKKDGKVITEFSDTAMGIHKLTATHGDTSMDVYVVPKSALSDEYVLFVRPDMRAYLLPLASAVVAASIHRCHIPVHIWIVGCALAIETSRCVHPAFVVGDVTEGVVLACCV
jgi:hypothetical protein